MRQDLPLPKRSAWSKNGLRFRGTIPVASVDQGKCMACGMCTAACRSTSIRLAENYNDAELIDTLLSWLGTERVSS